MQIRVATCQFPTGGDIQSNYSHIADLMRQAKDQNATVAHFCEAGLPGYVDSDRPSHDDLDWNLLREVTRELISLAGRLRLWTILGSAHPLLPPHKPHNSVYIIASSHLWISCANSSAKINCWGSFFIRPDGVVTGRLDRHSKTVLISVVDTDQEIYDSTQAWRSRALEGVLNSGTLVQDSRSANRTEV